MSKPQNNVVIVDPETDETQSESDAPQFKMYPVPTGKPGLGSKWCPTCNFKVGARAASCSNCNHKFDTGETVKKSVHKCPNCSEVIHHRAKKCDACGSEFAIEAHIIEQVEGAATSSPVARKSSAATSQEKPDSFALFKVLKSRGFELKVIQDVLDPTAKPQIEAGKDIKPLLDILENGEVEDISTKTKTRFAVDLDTMLSLLKIPQRK